MANFLAPDAMADRSHPTQGMPAAHRAMQQMPAENAGPIRIAPPGITSPNAYVTHQVCRPTRLRPCSSASQLFHARTCFAQANSRRPMSSPLSPALFGMVLAVREQCWHKAYRSMSWNQKFCPSHQDVCQSSPAYVDIATRYADNRVTILPRRFASLLPLYTLLLINFQLFSALTSV